MNYAEQIEEAANGEEIFAIVVGNFGGTNFTANPWTDENDPKTYEQAHIAFPTELKGKPIAWETAKKFLAYRYDEGYGGEDCHPIIAWTKNKVIFSGCYDGSTWVQTIPRNPQDTVPEFIGGG